MFKPLNHPVRDWSSKNIWIIGASSGIGASLAEVLLLAGAQVTVSARREGALIALATQHRRAHVVAFDVSSDEAWPLAMQKTLEKMGSIDLVVMGAARYDPAHSWDFKLEQANKSFDLNVLGIYRGLSVLVPYFLDKGEGGIAMVGSISSYTGLPRALIYGATKAAMTNLAETLYFELAPKGLDVYLISPGFVKTPMTAANDFEMPGLMTPQAAAAAIMAGFERGLFEIRFPRLFGGLLRLISRLPYWLRFKVLHMTTGM
jgi:NAD(P)-dependent dehydrogenase (short-subunit alcohol dehydrogenase family)